jgi:hypothetical protein
MDPDASLIRLLDTLRDGDRKAATEALMDLLDWIAKGGSMPTELADKATAQHLRMAAQTLIDLAERYERAANAAKETP